MKKQYSIPDEIVNATVRVLQDYRQQLEKEIKVLVWADATPAQMDEHHRRYRAFLRAVSAQEGPVKCWGYSRCPCPVRSCPPSPPQT